MIKRRFYREEHGEGDEPSSDSSSSSSSDYDSEVEAEESEDHAAVAEAKENDQSCSTSSGYEGEDSSADEVGDDSLGNTNEDDGTENDKQIPIGLRKAGKRNASICKNEFDDGIAEKESATRNMPEEFVLKFKSVYKCRICPQIVCLTEETMKTHLNSKRHARANKSLKENRLKEMLNSDGEIENQETAAEMNARIVALGQSKSKKKNTGRQRQKNRNRKKEGNDISNAKKTKRSIKTPDKKRAKNEN